MSIKLARSAPFYSYHHSVFLEEGGRCGLDKEIAPDGTYLAYFPFGAMIERSQMTSYHKKLLGSLLRLTLSPRLLANLKRGLV